MMNKPTVTILLAAYNGQAYIKAQLESILAQDYPNIRIVLSDDQSTDSTPEILGAFAASHPDVAEFYQSGLRFGNAQNHFLHLLNQFQDAEYIMFCDQDDIWHSDKVSKTLAFFSAQEPDPGVPTLVHTDLRVVDGQLKEISPSFCRLSALDGNRLALNQLLVQNVVTGCTMMINSALAKLACSSLPADGILMHDWYLALLASSCGTIAFLPEATLDYRQHGSNSVGAKSVYSLSYLRGRLTSRSMRQSLKLAAKQAEVFLNAYKGHLNSEQIALLQAFARTQSLNLLARNRIYFRYGLWKYGFIRRISQLLGL